MSQPPQRHSLPHYQHLPPFGTLVPIDEPVSTHHSKSRVYIRVPLSVVQSVGLDKCIITCIYQYSIIQSNFNALKILVFKGPRKVYLTGRLQGVEHWHLLPLGRNIWSYGWPSPENHVSLRKAPFFQNQLIKSGSDSLPAARWLLWPLFMETWCSDRWWAHRHAHG